MGHLRPFRWFTLSKRRQALRSGESTLIVIKWNRIKYNYNWLVYQRCHLFLFIIFMAFIFIPAFLHILRKTDKRHFSYGTLAYMRVKARQKRRRENELCTLHVEGTIKLIYGCDQWVDRDISFWYNIACASLTDIQSSLSSWHIFFFVFLLYFLSI